DVIAVLDSRDGAGEDGVGLAIWARSVVGDDRQGMGGDRQGAIGVGDRVVGVALAGTADWISADWTGLIGRGAADGFGAENAVIFIIYKADVVDGKDRVGLAIRPALVVGDSDQSGRVDGEGAIGGRDRVVAELAIGIKKAGHDVVSANGAISVCSTGIL